MGVGMGWGSPLFVVNVGLVVLVAMMATALARMRRNMRRAMAQVRDMGSVGGGLFVIGCYRVSERLGLFDW